MCFSKAIYAIIITIIFCDCTSVSENNDKMTSNGRRAGTRGAPEATSPPSPPKEVRKNGPSTTKSECYNCRVNHWCIDFKEGCAREITRLSTCLFCDLKAENNGLKTKVEAFKKQTEELMSNQNKELDRLDDKYSLLIANLREEFTGKFNTLQEENIGLKLKVARLNVLDTEVVPGEPARRVEGTLSQQAPPPILKEHAGQRDGGAVPSRSAVTTVRGGTERTARGVEGTLPRQGLPRAPSARGVNGPQVATGCNERSYSQAVKNGLNKPKTPKRKNPQGKGQVRSKPEVEGMLPKDSHQTLLWGDSMVRNVSKGIPKGSKQRLVTKALPGSGLDRVTRDLSQTNVERNNPLIVTAGGNDLFLRGGATGYTEPIMNSYKKLIKVVRSKSDKGVIVGLIPRKNLSEEALSKARGINSRLESVCRVQSIRFINPWETFYGKWSLLAKDGIHFSKAGTVKFRDWLLKNGHFKVKTKRNAQTRNDLGSTESNEGMVAGGSDKEDSGQIELGTPEVISGIVVGRGDKNNLDTPDETPPHPGNEPPSEEPLPT